MLAVKTGVVSLGLLKVGDDSWGVVGSDHSPRSQEEEKQNQIQPYILPRLKKAKNKHCGWMDGRCLHICVCGVSDCCVVAAALSGFQVSHWCSTALPEDDVLLTPYRQRHQRFWHTHNVPGCWAPGIGLCHKKRKTKTSVASESAAGGHKENWGWNLSPHKKTTWRRSDGQQNKGGMEFVIAKNKYSRELEGNGI